MPLPLVLGCLRQPLFTLRPVTPLAVHQKLSSKVFFRYFYQPAHVTTSHLEYVTAMQKRRLPAVLPEDDLPEAKRHDLGLKLATSHHSQNLIDTPD
jgi:hypothetical protein